MTRSKAAQQVILAFLVLGAFAPVSRAVLLAEVGINIPATFDPSPPPQNSLSYSFAGGVPGMLGQFHRQVTAPDVGLTFDAPFDVMQNFAQGIIKPSAGINIALHANSFSRPLDQLQAGAWAECCEIVTFRKFVPDITKVPVNRLTMTIDSFHFERFGQNGSTGGAHTIRIYGVPETSCVTIATTGLSCLLFMGSRLWSPRSQ
jgi:hypothetical protein